MTNSLGSFNFVSFRNLSGRGGGPALPKEMTEISVRHGVDGVGTRLLGTKGRPFQMVSGRDFATQALALTEYQAYLAAVGTALDIVWRDIIFSAENITYHVLDVSDDYELIPLKNISGGIVGASANGAWLQVTWTLLPVSTDQEEPV